MSNGTDVVLQSGDLYFVNASGAILKHYTITSSTTSATNINMTEAHNGASITNLPGNTEMVYVVGNTSGLPTSGNISTVQEVVLQVESQNDIEDANLYGSGPLVDRSFGVERIYTKGNPKASATNAPGAIAPVATPAIASTSGKFSIIKRLSSIFINVRILGYDINFRLSQ